MDLRKSRRGYGPSASYRSIGVPRSFTAVQSPNALEWVSGGDRRELGNIRPFDVPILRTRSLRDRAHDYMGKSRTGLVWDAFVLLTCLVSVVLYVYSTYDVASHEAKWKIAMEWVIVVIFIGDVAVQLLIKASAVKYLLSMDGVIDALTIIPMLIDLTDSSSSERSSVLVEFMKVMRMLRILRAYRLISVRVGHRRPDSIAAHAERMAMQLFTLIFICAGFIQAIESPDIAGGLLGKEESLNAPVHFHEAFYFVVITLTTVGYGDYNPVSVLGQMFTVCFVSVSAILLPYHVTRLVGIIRLHTAYKGRFSMPKKSKHIVILGQTSERVLESFLEEFYNPGHGQHQLKTVILNKTEPSFTTEKFLKSSQYSDRVTWLVGNPLRDDDLYRCNLQKADTCFILNEAGEAMGGNSDEETILEILAVRNMTSTARVIAQVRHPANRAHALAAGANNVMCMNELKFSILAATSLCPGATTLISNLFLSGIDHDDQKNWVGEYSWGASQEVYPVVLPEVLHGLDFQTASLKVYEKYGCILFGVKVFDPISQSSTVLLNPKDFRISPSDVGFVVAEEYGSTYLIATWSDKFPKHSVFDRDLASKHIIRSFHSYFDSLWEKVTTYNSKNAIDGGSRHALIAECSQRGEETCGSLAGGNNTLHPSARTSYSPEDIPLQAPVSSGWTLSQSVDGDRSDVDDTCPSDDSLGGVISELKDNKVFNYLVFAATGIKRPPHTFLKLSETYRRRKHIVLSKSIAESLDGHIIICGFRKDLYTFLLQLRSKSLKKQLPIVIISPTDFGGADMQLFAALPAIYVHKASPRSHLDLSFANIEKASQVMCISERKMNDEVPESMVPSWHFLSQGVNDALLRLGSRVSVTSDGDSTADGDLFDKAGSMTVFWDISLAFPDVPAIVELDHAHSVKLLQPAEMRGSQLSDKDAWKIPLYASGSVSSQSFVDSLVTQVFFNPYLIDVVEQLVSSVRQTNHVHHSGESLQLVPVPEELLKGKQSVSFLEVYTYLLRKDGDVALGLMRPKGYLDSSKGYVYMCPHTDAPVSRTDYVYIVAPATLSARSSLGSRRMSCKTPENADPGIAVVVEEAESD